MSSTGKLYGVGLGPGDPELITLKAARLIQGADIIAYPAAEGVPSFARSIAADLLAHGPEEIAIEMPMVAERFPAQAIYDEAAEKIASHLEAGRDVVVLCEGDPFFYGSFMYLYARMADRYPVEVVPGVTSVTACAAVAGVPLVARNDRLTVLTGPMPEMELAERLRHCDAAVIMKLGRHFGKVKRALAANGLTDRAVYVERATLPAQRIGQVSEISEAPYFSMILVQRATDTEALISGR